MLCVLGCFFAKLLNHSMFEILIGLLSANNAEVDLLWQFEDSGAKSFVWCEPSLVKLESFSCDCNSVLVQICWN